MSNYLEFRKELEGLISRYNMESGSNTQDFILANFLCGCLVAFDNALTEKATLSQGTQSQGDV